MRMWSAPASSHLTLSISTAPSVPARARARQRSYSLASSAFVAQFNCRVVGDGAVDDPENSGLDEHPDTKRRQTMNAARIAKLQQLSRPIMPAPHRCAHQGKSVIWSYTCVRESQPIRADFRPQATLRGLRRSQPPFVYRPNQMGFPQIARTALGGEQSESKGRIAAGGTE